MNSRDRVTKSILSKTELASTRQLAVADNVSPSKSRSESMTRAESKSRADSKRLEAELFNSLVQSVSNEFVVSLGELPKSLIEEIFSAEHFLVSSSTSSAPLSSVSPIDALIDSQFLSSSMRTRLLDHLRMAQCQGLLINGSSETVLARKLKPLRGAIRAIYIDPPYNTGNGEMDYRDRYSSNEWTVLLESVLTHMSELLAEDGSVFVSIDDNEMPYLRLMMDRIFDRESFVSSIAYERSGSAGLGQGGVMLNTKEHILFYSRNKGRLNTVESERPLDLETMRRYSKILLDSGKRELILEFSAGNGQTVKLFEHRRWCVEPISLRSYDSRYQEVDSTYRKNFDKIFRTQNVQRENTFQNDLIAKMRKDGLYSVDYVPSRGKHRNQQTTLYYHNGELCAWLKDSSRLESTRIIKTNKLTDFWTHAEIPKADLANEGGVNFKRGKKPEHLLHRILSLSTDPGDIVLDCFLGSGTTAAVAHKMGRRWIGIECGAHFNDVTLARLKRVVAGDKTGVSRKTGFTGGGLFGYRTES